MEAGLICSMICLASVLEQSAKSMTREDMQTLILRVQKITSGYFLNAAEKLKPNKSYQQVNH